MDYRWLANYKQDETKEVSCKKARQAEAMSCGLA
jgi:hypothetical protein